MNTQLTETQRRSPVISTAGTASRLSAPANPLERIALRVGIALILWGGRRNTANTGREELIRRHQARVAQNAREGEYRRRLSLNWPRV